MRKKGKKNIFRERRGGGSAANKHTSQLWPPKQSEGKMKCASSQVSVCASLSRCWGTGDEPYYCKVFIMCSYEKMALLWIRQLSQSIRDGLTFSKE